MKNFRWWPAIGSIAWVGATLLLAGCGSGGDSGDSGSMRLVNATLTHSSLDLLQDSNSAIAGTTVDTVSGYVDVGTGSPTLQLRDTGTSTTLVTTSATITSGQHYVMLAYESGGIVKTAVLTEDYAAPTSGTGQLRLYDTALDAGAIDVYVTDPSTDLSTVAAPTVSFAAQSYAQSSDLLSYAPGTYRVRVTLSGNKTQVLLDMPSVAIANQQIVTIPLTPAAGGILLDGSALVQQAGYTPARNTTARVRLAAAVSDGPSVAANAGGAQIDSFAVAPAVGAYAVVPAAGALNISVNGNSIAAPAATLKAGNDYTLLVYGAPATATASLVGDDNHLPTSSSNVKMRLVNGITGSAAGLTLNASFVPVAANIGPGVASAYGTVAGSTSMDLDVSSSASSTALWSRSGANIAGPSVYTVFMLGDVSQPQGTLRRDR